MSVSKFLRESVELLNSVCVAAEERMVAVFRQMQRMEDSLGRWPGQAVKVSTQRDFVVIFTTFGESVYFSQFKDLNN